MTNSGGAELSPQGPNSVTYLNPLHRSPQFMAGGGGATNDMNGYHAQHPQQQEAQQQFKRQMQAHYENQQKHPAGQRTASHQPPPYNHPHQYAAGPGQRDMEPRASSDSPQPAPRYVQYVNLSDDQ